MPPDAGVDGSSYDTIAAFVCRVKDSPRRITTCSLPRLLTGAGTGGAIVVDSEWDFAGVVLGNRLASKENTMGPRMKLLDLMAES